MSARAPAAIFQLWNDISHRIPQARLGGIVGDVAHSFGYHLARRDLPASDYSVQLRDDRKGPSDAASALDVSLPPDLMRVCTQRLVDAARNGDPRMKAVREFCGTLDGWQTYPWQLVPQNASEGVGSWDDSHLWHVHVSFLRRYCDDYEALAPLADVFAGVPLMKEFTVDADAKKRFDQLEKDVADLRSLLRSALSGADGEPHRITTLLSQTVNTHVDAKVGKVLHDPEVGLDTLAPFIKGQAK